MSGIVKIAEQLSIYQMADAQTSLVAHGFQVLRLGISISPIARTYAGSIPDDTDVLVTHMPLRFYLDVAGFGDDDLFKEL